MFIAMWALLTGLFIVIDARRGVDALFIDRSTAALLSITGMYAGLSLVGFSYLRSMFSSLRYLERNSAEKPVFKRKQVRSFEIDMPSDFDFNRLKTKIAEKWLITFSDDVVGVLKFREKWSFTEGIGGIGAWVNYDSTTQKLYVEGFAQLEKRYLKEEVQELQKEIANCVGVDIADDDDD